MDTHTFFVHLLLILIVSRLLAELAVRFQAPAVIGELTAGVILGPSLLGWIEPTTTIQLLAEIGIILLLFKVGIETDIRRLINAGRQSLIVAMGGFFMPLLSGFALSYWIFNLGGLVSLFIGGTLTATSIGITIRVLSDLKRQHEKEGEVVLGAAVLDDVMGVILLAILYEFSISGGVSVTNVGKVLTFIMLFFLFAPIAAKLISVMIRRFDDYSTTPGLIPIMIISLVLFFAWLAHVVGAPELLGGFAAGLALSRRFFLPFGMALHNDRKFAGRIEVQMNPIVYIFSPIFFVTVGLSLSLREIDWSSPFIWSFALSFFIIAVAAKFFGAMLINAGIRQRVAIGLAMVPRGEVGLIFAELGRSTNIFDIEVYAGMIIVITLTTLLSPFALKWFYVHYFEQSSSACDQYPANGPLTR
ncbi:MAG: cation:proton antiporter [Candidatus Thiodiazotropha sp.]|nr:cation:proton antiporter [Candidatus Thiodiazotropha taylori]MBV2093445.1 cation:proton antiporter [Candidatus Thiodiazotropha sp. (ex Codakia orbicularis)]